MPGPGTSRRTRCADALRRVPRACPCGLRALLSRLGSERLAFALGICALVSTQVLFQPQLYTPFSPADVARAWVDYLVECLLMGLPVAIALTAAEG